MILALLNSPSLAELPRGWELFSHTPAKYQGSRHSKDAHGGRACGRLLAAGPTQARDWVSLFQKIQSHQFRGRTVTLSGYLKPTEVTGWAGIWLRVEDGDEEVLEFENSSKKPLRGTSEWQPYSIEVNIPENAEVLHFGVLLAGGGDIRVDDLSLTATGPSRPVKNIISTLRERALPTEPSNLDFEK